MRIKFLKTGDNEEYKNVLLLWTVVACVVVALLTGLSIYFYDVSPKNVEITDSLIPRKEYQAIYLLPKEKHADDKYRLNDFLEVTSRLGIKAYAVDEISNNEECMDLIREYISRDVSIIVSPSPALNECINTAVKKYDNTKNVYFVSAYDRNLEKSDKLITFKVHQYQVYYLSGIIAATVNTETSENFFVVSELNEDAYRNINAFTLGVRKYKKNGIVKVIVLKSKNENIQYSQLIEAQKRNPDARIMTADYTDITVDDFCEQKMYYCIRYDKDFANKYFLSNIASVQVDYRGFFSRVLSRTVTNSFESGNYLLDVSTGTVRITNFNEGIIPPNTMQLLDLALYRFMIANNDNIFSGPLYDNEHRLRLDKGYSLQDEPNDIFSMDWFVEGAVLEHL